MLLPRRFFEDAANEAFTGYASEKLLVLLWAAQDRLEQHRGAIMWAWIFGLCITGGAIWRLNSPSPSPWEFVWLVLGVLSFIVGVILQLLTRTWKRLLQEAEKRVRSEAEAANQRLATRRAMTNPAQESYI